MPESSPKRMRAFLVVAVLSCAALAAFFSVRNSTSEGKVLDAVARLQAQEDAFELQREAPYGETSEGEAWPHYEAAIAELRNVEGLKDLEKKLWMNELSIEERDDLVAGADAVFASLRAGAASRQATRRVDSSPERTETFSIMNQVRSVTNLAVARAKVLLEEGDPEEAVRTLLDSQQLSADLMSSPLMVEEAMGMGTLVFEHTIGLVEGEHYGMLSQAAKEQWVSGMRRIESGIPGASRSYQGSILRSARLAQESFEDGSFDQHEHAQGRWTRWLPDFVWRSGFHDFVLRAEQLGEDVDQAFELPRPKVTPELERLLAAFADRPNITTHAFLPRTDSLGAARMMSFTRLDMLCHAICLEAGLPDPQPESNTSAPVGVTQAGGKVMVTHSLAPQIELAITLGAN